MLFEPLNLLLDWPFVLVLTQPVLQVSSQPGFLSLLLPTRGGGEFLWEGLSDAFGMFSSITGLFPRDASSIFPPHPGVAATYWHMSPEAKPLPVVTAILKSPFVMCYFMLNLKVVGLVMLLLGNECGMFLKSSVSFKTAINTLSLGETLRGVAWGRAGGSPRSAGLMTTLCFQLKRMEESHQEATEKEVERILGLLQTYFREDRKYAAEFLSVQGVPLFLSVAPTVRLCRRQLGQPLCSRPVSPLQPSPL